MNDSIQQWLGKEEKQVEFAAQDYLIKLAALLDGQPKHWQDNVLPPLAHWCICQPIEVQSKIDRDGHIQRGEFMPPITLPRRMWASSEVQFIEALPLNQNLTRRSLIEKIESKTNKSGEPLIFLTVKHKITAATSGLIEETQHIVYKADTDAKPIVPRAATQEPQQEKEIRFDIVKLFRFSALTFNAHRIHYDRDYAKSEGYPALVVHGPYLAFLLLDFYCQHKGTPKQFSFRAESPLFDTQKAKLCLNDNHLWIERQDEQQGEGHRSVIMSAQAL